MRNEFLEDPGAPSIFEEEVLVPIWLSSLMACLFPLRPPYPSCFFFFLYTVSICHEPF